MKIGNTLFLFVVVALAFVVGCAGPAPLGQVTTAPAESKLFSVVNGEAWVTTLKANVISARNVNLSWEKVPGAESYEFYIEDECFEVTKDCYLNIVYLMPNTEYTFKVKVIWKKK